jgi:hypothetical protein
MVIVYIYWIAIFIGYPAFVRNDFVFPILAMDTVISKDYLSRLIETRSRLSNARSDMLYSVHRGNPEILFMLAEASAPTDKTRAMEYYRQAVSLDPTNRPYRSSYVTFLYKNTLYKELAEELGARGGYGLGKEWLGILYSQGFDKIRINRFDAAIPFWKPLIDISPSWSLVHVEYAALLEYERQHDKAVQVLQMCSQDRYAGKHCSLALGLLGREQLPGPGYYCFEITHSDLCFRR